MTSALRWDPCVSHRGTEADAFVREYFGRQDRQVVLIAGAGFDPRSTRVAELLAGAASARVAGHFLREHRPVPRPELIAAADRNEARLRQLVPESRLEAFDVFDIDSAPVGGRRATALLNRSLALDGVTDVVVDCSALSVGVFFPVVRYCYERVRAVGCRSNLHVMVMDDPGTDAAFEATPCGKAGTLHGFQGGIGLDPATSAAILWLPQLGRGRREVLKLVHQFVRPHAVCPILPFPATHPRFADSLIEEYGELFETISDPFETTWQVDARDLVYADEKSPLDLYRTILRIDGARRRVFSGMGGSQVVLTPVGSKALALGVLMAALERDFAVVSVETMAYKAAVSPDSLACDAAELVHIWLHGDAYLSAAVA